MNQNIEAAYPLMDNEQGEVMPLIKFSDGIYSCELAWWVDQIRQAAGAPPMRVVEMDGPR